MKQVLTLVSLGVLIELVWGQFDSLVTLRLREAEVENRESYEQLRKHHLAAISGNPTRSSYNLALKYLFKSSLATDLCVGTSSPPESPQCFSMILDTGSTNLWLPTTDCKHAACLQHPRFDPSKSSTFGFQVDNKGKSLEFEVIFGSGKISGVLAQDRVFLGGKQGIEIPFQSFGAVSEEEGEGFASPLYSGVIGLAYPSMAAYGHVPLFDNLMEQGILTENTFSFRFDRFEPTFLIGKPDLQHYHAPFHWLHVESKRYWSAKLVDVTLNGVSMGFCRKGCLAVFDSGTTLNTSPSSDLGKLLRSIGHDPSKTCTASMDEMPTVSYVFENGISFSLQPRDYVSTEKGSSCGVQYMAMDIPDAHENAWILGTVFLKRYYVLFDRGNDRMGVTLANYDEHLESQQSSTSTLLRFNRA